VSRAERADEVDDAEYGAEGLLVSLRDAVVVVVSESRKEGFFVRVFLLGLLDPIFMIQTRR